MEADDIGWACEEREECAGGTDEETWRKKIQLGKLVVEGKLILIMILYI